MFADFLVSPRAHGQDLLCRIRSEPKSKSPIYIACGGVEQVPIPFPFQYFDPLNTVQLESGHGLTWERPTPTGTLRAQFSSFGQRTTQ